jgi:hypothetical protein
LVRKLLKQGSGRKNSGPGFGAFFATIRTARTISAIALRRKSGCAFADLLLPGTAQRYSFSRKAAR